MTTDDQLATPPQYSPSVTPWCVSTAREACGTLHFGPQLQVQRSCC